ncbi:hypothetical protein ABT336_08855 [Micromonospora sp. NPDC000207]|uniref:hypothetical protein n=1 Tax=Micromonospora sp. NPDC000207 TaxID=3154246 RepID=UPI003331E9F3
MSSSARHVPGTGAGGPPTLVVDPTDRWLAAMIDACAATGEGYDRAAGRSGIWAADGTIVVEAGPEPGAVVRANLLDATVAVDGDGRPGRLG